MEPNKLEKDFKKKLDERTIQPSEMAWDRLDAMLSVAEKKKPKKRTWLYIAASFLGFLLVGTIFFNQSEAVIEKGNDVVVTEEKTEKTVENSTPEGQNTKSSNQITIVNSEAIASRLPVQKKNQKAGSSTSLKKEDQALQPTQEKTEMIASAGQNEMTKANKYIESEQLLAEAETRIQSQSIKKYVAKSSVKVDSKGLLSSVEGELNETFRDKVVKSIGKNYENVKTSLANRNNE
ncbi:hypothetical protein D3C87_73510 [compost metagenome]